MNVIHPFVILLCISYKNFAIEIPDTERRIAIRKAWVNEAVGSHLMKIFIEGVDLAVMEICRIQEIVAAGYAKRCAFVNGVVAALAVIDGDNSVCRIHRRVPT
jgi:hypothetical protein